MKSEQRAQGLQAFTLPAGAMCWRDGIPFRLMHATQIECHPDNWPLIERGPAELDSDEPRVACSGIDAKGAQT